MRPDIDLYRYGEEQNLEVISPLLWNPRRFSDWEYGIVVRVNGSTAMRLYGDYFHWLTYTYMAKRRDKKGRPDFSLDSDSKVHLYSCDDSSFGIWLPVDSYSNFSDTWSKLLGFVKCWHLSSGLSIRLRIFGKENPKPSAVFSPLHN